MSRTEHAGTATVVVSVETVVSGIRAVVVSKDGVVGASVTGALVVSGIGASVTIVVVTTVVVSTTAMQATAETSKTSDGSPGLVETNVIFRELVSTGVMSGTTTVIDPSGTDSVFASPVGCLLLSSG